MVPRTDDTPLIVILGITGSGKSALGLDLARLFDGEIVAADSRTIYRGMDISTAKPSSVERLEVPHHLIDVVYPDQRFTVSDFKSQAAAAIDDIGARSKTPILVGGSGLYIDALLYDFTLRPTLDKSLRDQLAKKTVAELRQRVIDDGLELPMDGSNPRRLIRTVESGGAMPMKRDLRPSTLVLGLYMDRETLLQRLAARVDGMVEAGLIDELQRLADRYGWDTPAMQTPGCRAFRNFLQGDMTLVEAKALFIRNDMNLAKRQHTWFKRNQDVHWVKSKEESVELVTTFLNKY